MVSEQERALLQELGRAANTRDVQRIMEFYAADAVSISPVFGEVRGRPAIARTWEQMFQTMPDMQVVMSDALKDEDRIAMIGTVTATDRVGWFGMPPTGGTFSYRIVLLLTLSGLQIVRDERIYDLETVRQSLEKVRIQAELKLAAEVQSALLPTKVHAASFCQGIGASIPSREIGGDFFQFLTLPNGDCGVALADVAGKGPSAAILAAMLQGMLSVEARIENRIPSQTLARINAAMTDLQLGTRFVTMIYGILNPEGKFVYSNAGHHPPFLIDKSGLSRLENGDLIAGVFDNVTFEDHTIQLQPGDGIVMFTDGVTEATDSRGEYFGEDRLSSSVAANSDLPPPDLLQRVIGAVHDFTGDAEPADDLTLVALRFSGT